MVWRTDIYMSFMVRMVCGLENRYIHVVHVLDGMWSGEQIWTCRSCIGWYAVWRTDMYMSFMFRMICGLENRYVHVIHV